MLLKCFNTINLYTYLYSTKACVEIVNGTMLKKNWSKSHMSVFLYPYCTKKRVWPSSLHEEECWRRTRCTVLTLFRMVWRNGVSPLPGQTVTHSLSIVIMLVSFPLYNQSVSFPIAFALFQPDVAAPNAPECNDTLKAIEVQDMADSYYLPYGEVLFQ